MLESRLRRMGRRALVADEIPAPGASVLCRQGGAFLAAQGELPPVRGGVSLVPILAVHTAELPYVPDFFVGYRYWTFFIQPDLFEQTTEDGSLVVRRYPEVEGLKLSPDQARSGEALRFREVVDFPSTYTLRELATNDRDLAEALEVADVERAFPCHSGLKLGGYPCMVQGTHFLKSLDPDFQVQFDVCDAYEFGDSGIGFVYGNLQAVIWECLQELPNKRFKLTRLGWKQSEGWSAAILRGYTVIVGGGSRMLASQLKRGVVRTWTRALAARSILGVEQVARKDLQRMITVRRVVTGKMSVVAFLLGIAAFLLGFLHPGFWPLAWFSLLGGSILAVLLWARHSRASHPTVSHLEPDTDEGRPIHPR